MASDRVQIEFYFDPVSPYAWLALEQLDQIEIAGGRLVCRPILFAALLNAHGTTGPAEVPAKRAYMFRDVMRQAQRLHLPFRGPPSHPFNPLAALRALHAVGDPARQWALARCLVRAAWREGLDLADSQDLRDALTRGGFDTDALLTAVTTPEIKLRLRRATQQAIDTGIFGVPTFRLDNELFWGADRIDAVTWAIRGGTIDDGLYQRVLHRPRAADR